MLEGLYTALAGMEAADRANDALASDIANLDTPGYKAQQVHFHDLLYSSSGQGAGAAVTVRPGFQQGALYSTGRSLDMAIEGDGFFQVRRPDGTHALTRDGAFGLDVRGRLTTASGDLLTPPITVPPGTNPSQVAVGGDGTVTVNGRPAGRLAIVTVPAPSQLSAVGAGQFVTTAASGGVRAAAGSRVHQGELEASTANMTELVGGSRSFQFLSKVVQAQDQMAQVANQLIK